jgi:hypothetical protein
LPFGCSFEGEKNNELFFSEMVVKPPGLLLERNKRQKDGAKVVVHYEVCLSRLFPTSARIILVCWSTQGVFEQETFLS